MAEETGRLAYCNLPAVTPRQLPPGLGMPHTEALVQTVTKWINGTTLTYCFVRIGQSGWPQAQMEVVHRAFQQWKALGIGLDFAETADKKDATLLIGLVPGDGSWSYVGTDVLKNRNHGRNMNFGWDLTTTWGHATALHEIGHALGMPHEHQNPKSGIVWNESKVLEYFSQSPNNWDEKTIRWNILRHLSPAEVEGSNWDPGSIMHYPFDRGLISAPPPYDTDGVPSNVELSKNDQQWIQRFYPPLAPATPIQINTLAPIATKIAAQSDFIFTPAETRSYRLQAVGEADLKLGLLEQTEDGALTVLQVEDDSATASNAAITRELEKGKHYRLSARMHYTNHPGGAALTVF